jgi:hypothetical protein
MGKPQKFKGVTKQQDDLEVIHEQFTHVVWQAVVDGLC